jgi:hypothetical protein
MTALGLVSPDFFNIRASSCSGSLAKVEKKDKEVSHLVFTTKIHWGALS